MKCDEAARLTGLTSFLQGVFSGSEHDWRIINVHATYDIYKPAALEEKCRRCTDTRIRRSGHTVAFWNKVKSEQPEG